MKAIVDYMHLAGEFTNPFQFVSGAIISGLLAFAIAVLLVILLRRYILVSRTSKFLKYAAWAYFIILPLLAGFFGFKWGFFHSLRKDINTHREVYVRHIPPTFDQQASAAVNHLLQGSELTHANSNQLIDAVADALYNAYGSTLEKERSKEGVQGKLAAFMYRATQGKGIAEFIKKTIRNLLHEKLGLDESVSKELMETKITEILRGGLFVNIAIIQVDHFLYSMQKGVVITFLLLLAIPLGEILTAHYLLRKKKREVIPNNVVAERV